MGNDAKKKDKSLNGYKGQTLPTTGVEVKIRAALLDSMSYYEFNQEDVAVVAKFTIDLEHQGFSNLKGRNKQSNNPPDNDPEFYAKAQFANQYKLFHYHIGIPYYVLSRSGDLTSDYVIQYSFDSDTGYVDIINVEYHPLELPSIEDLESELIENPFK